MDRVEAPDTGHHARETLLQRIELLSSAVMAAATIATAYSAYESALWTTEYASHKAASTTATIRAAEFSNLAMQRSAVHVSLFLQWLAAARAGDTASADFLLARLPEPLGEATRIWWASSPLTNAEAAASPFDLPEYRITE